MIKRIVTRLQSRA